MYAISVALLKLAWENRSMDPHPRGVFKTMPGEVVLAAALKTLLKREVRRKSEQRTEHEV